MHSETIKELATALCKAQSIMKAAEKSRENPFYKSKYADLKDVWDVCRKPFTDNGLSLAQLPTIQDDGNMILESILMHNSGEWISCKAPLKATKPGSQALGIEIKYMRRYCLESIGGIVSDEDPEDDDANSTNIMSYNQTPPNNNQKKNNEQPPKINRINLEQYKSQLSKCENLEELKNLWLGIPNNYKSELDTEKNKAKERLTSSS